MAGAPQQRAKRGNLEGPWVQNGRWHQNGSLQQGAKKAQVAPRAAPGGFRHLLLQLPLVFGLLLLLQDLAVWLWSTARLVAVQSRDCWSMQVSGEEQAAMDKILAEAFEQDDDEAWDQVLEETGAASYNDDRKQSPLINVQHSRLGLSCAPALHITVHEPTQLV